MSKLNLKALAPYAKSGAKTAAVLAGPAIVARFGPEVAASRFPQLAAFMNKSNYHLGLVRLGFGAAASLAIAAALGRKNQAMFGKVFAVGVAASALVAAQPAAQPFIDQGLGKVRQWLGAAQPSPAGLLSAPVYSMAALPRTAYAPRAAGIVEDVARDNRRRGA